MVASVNVIGRGRVGSALAARLEERGVTLVDRDAELTLLCVPDTAIGDVAQGQSLGHGLWIAHVSGATPLSALDPHERRFSLHPFQTFTRARGPEQLDGAWAAVTAETEEARTLGFELAHVLGLRPFELGDDARPLYHAGAAVASNYLVTLHRVASELVVAAGAPPEALEPLMRRTIENGFELTGPIERGDWDTVESHRAAIRSVRPDLEPLYDVLANATLSRSGVEGEGSMRTVRTAAELRALPRSGSVGLVPTMGAFHDGHLSLMRAARAENDVVVVSLFVNRAQFGPEEDLERYPRDEERDAALAEEAGVDVLFVPPVEEIYPPGFQTWVEVEELGSILEGEHRPGHFRGVATVCLKLFNLVLPDRAYFGQKDAQQAAVVKRMVRDLAVGVEIRVCPTVRDGDGLALSSRNAYLSPGERRAALALPRALQANDPALLDGLEVDYFEVADLEPRVLAAAVRVGQTRLIDNVILEGEEP